MKRSLLFIFALQQNLYGETITVSTWDELNNAISGGSSYANQPDTLTTIKFLNDITHSGDDLTTFLTPLCIDSPNSVFNLLDQCSITIDGQGYTLSPANLCPGFFVGGNPFVNVDAKSSVTLQNIIIDSAQAQGGGSRRGGGGAGLGGALFVNTNTSVTLLDVTFSNCSANGGNTTSGTGTVGGGGGMAGSSSSAQGAGGFNQSGNSNNGGGCTFIPGSAGTPPFVGGQWQGGVGTGGGIGGGPLGGAQGEDGGDAASGGGSGIYSGGNGGNGGGSYSPGYGGALGGIGGNAGIGGGAGGNGSTSGGGGGGGGYVGGGGCASGTGTVAGGGGGFGGGGASGSAGGGGGGGGFGGGGGGTTGLNGGGGGGFGGGGGGSSAAWNGGNGGFGGGGGEGGSGGTGGFGGGAGSATGISTEGGGGMGAGGAIFIHSGGQLIIKSATITGSAVNAGSGYEAGSAYGKDIFLVSGGQLNFNLTSDTNCFAIGGNHGEGGFTTTATSGVIINNNPGVTLTFSSTGISDDSGLFDGVLELNGGICSIDSDFCLGFSSVNPSINGGELATTQSISTGRTFTIGSSGATLLPATSTTLAFTGTVVGSKNATLTLSGVGTTTFSTLEVDSGTFTLSGPFGGSGTVAKMGNGTLLLPTNVPSFTGNLTVNAGVLKVNGILNSSSEITLASNTTLSGTGTVGGISCSGTIAPGNSVGTMHSGSVMFNPGAIFQIAIDPNAASILAVTGTADLDGSVQVIQEGGSYQREGSYPILTTTGGITGAFKAAVVGGLNGYNFSLSQLGDDLYLLYSVSSLSTSGLSGNALKVANYLNQNGNGTSLVLLNDLTESDLKAALDSISPSRNAFGSFTAAQTAFSFSNLVSAHLDGVRFAQEVSQKRDFTAALLVDAAENVRHGVGKYRDRFSAWVSGFGEFAHLTASDQNPAFNFATGAVLAGFDYRGQNKGLVGGSLGYARSHYYANQDAGSGNINFYVASVYGNVFAGNFYFSPALWGIFNQTDNKRNVAFPGFSASAEADILAWQLVPHLEVGYEWKFSWGEVVPFTAMDWAVLWQRGYTETGASPYNAVQSVNDSSFLRSETGLKLCQQWEKSWGLFLLKEKVSYVLEKPFGTGNVQASFVGMPSSFTVTAVDHLLNLGAIGMDFLFAVGKDRSLTIDFDYEGEFGSQYWSNELMLTIGKRF